MNNILLFRKEKLIEDWLLCDDYNSYIVYNNIKLYPYVYNINNKNDIYYINEYGITYAPDKKTMLYCYENLFIQHDNH